MKLKPGVIWSDMHPKIESALFPIESVYNKFNTEMVITSGRDGKHMEGSLHYDGKAIDVRTWGILQTFTRMLKAELGSDYDVVLEGDHVHIEFDPKQ